MDVEKKIRETVAAGGVLAHLYFDLHAKSREAVQEIGTGFVQDLLKQEGVVYALGEIEEPVLEKDVYSSHMQVKILTKSFKRLADICTVNSPFTVEILRPDEIRLSLNEAHELLTNISTATAEYKRYIVEKLSKPEDLEKYRHFMQKRMEMGKKILTEEG